MQIPDPGERIVEHMRALRGPAHDLADIIRVLRRGLRHLIHILLLREDASVPLVPHRIHHRGLYDLLLFFLRKAEAVDVLPPSEIQQHVAHVKDDVFDVRNAQRIIPDLDHGKALPAGID